MALMATDSPPAAARIEALPDVALAVAERGLEGAPLVPRRQTEVGADLAGDGVQVQCVRAGVHKEAAPDTG